MKKFTDEHLRIFEKENFSCTDISNLLCDYADQDLPIALKGRFDAHCSRCPECSELVRGYQFTIDLAAELADRPMPQDAKNRLRIALNERLGTSLPVTLNLDA